MATASLTQRIALVGAEEIRRQFERIGESGKKAFDGLSDAQKATAPAARQLAQELKGVEISIRRVSDESDRAQEPMLGFKAKMALVATATVGAIATLAKFTKGIIDSYDALGKQAAQLGISAGQLDRYQKAAAVAGVDADKLAVALRTIGSDIANAAEQAKRATSDFVEVSAGRFKQGALDFQASALKIGDAFAYMDKGIKRTTIVTKENIESLKAIQQAQSGATKGLVDNANAYQRYNVDLVKSRDEAYTLAEVLDQISKRINETSDAAERAKIAEAFNLKEVLPLLTDTEKGFGELLKLVQQFSADESITNKLAKDAREFNKQIEILKLQFKSGASSLARGVGAFFTEPFEKMLERLKSGTSDAATEIKNATTFLSTVFYGLKSRFGDSLEKAFAKPLAELLTILKDSKVDLDQVFKDISTGVADFVTDIVRVFAFTFKDGQFQFIRSEDAKVQNKWLITIRESAVKLGKAIEGAYKNYIEPAFTKMAEYSEKASKAFKQLFGVGINFAEVGVIVALAHITGLLGPIATLAKVAGAALLSVFAPAIGLYTLLGDNFVDAIKNTIEFIKQLFAGAQAEAEGFVKEIKKLFGEIGDVSEEAQKKQGGPTNKYSRTVDTPNPYARSLPSTKEAKEQAKAATQVGDAWKKVKKELQGVFDVFKAVYEGLKPIATFLLDSINKIFGSEITPAQAGIILVLLQVTGGMRILHEVTRTAVIVFASFTTALVNIGTILRAVTLSIALLSRGLVALAFAASGSVLSAFTKLGTYIAGAFTAKSAAGIGRLLVLFGRFIPWVGAIITILAGVIAYWDEIKEFGEKAYNYLKKLWAGLWGDPDTSAQEKAVKRLAELQARHVRKVPQEAKGAWETFFKWLEEKIKALGEFFKKAFDPSDEPSTAGGKWLKSWYDSLVMKIGEIKAKLLDLFATQPKPADKQWQEDYGQGFQNQLNQMEGDAKGAFKAIEASAKDAIVDPDEFGFVRLQDDLSGLGDEAEGTFQQVANAIQNASNISVSTAALTAPWEQAYNQIINLFVVQFPVYIQAAFDAAVAAAEAAAVRIEAAAARIIAAAAAARAAANSMGGGSSSNSFASGGYVRGPGTGTSDSIPAYLSNGEFVLRAAAVRKYGVDLLYKLNGLRVDPRKIKEWPGFAMGGLVSMANKSTTSLNTVPTMVTPVMPGKAFDLIIDGQRFGNVFAGEDVAGELMRFAQASKMRSGGRKPGWYK